MSTNNSNTDGTSPTVHAMFAFIREQRLLITAQLESEGMEPSEIPAEVQRRLDEMMQASAEAETADAVKTGHHNRLPAPRPEVTLRCMGKNRLCQMEAIEAHDRLFCHHHLLEYLRLKFEVLYSYPDTIGEPIVGADVVTDDLLYTGPGDDFPTCDIWDRYVALTTQIISEGTGFDVTAALRDIHDHWRATHNDAVPAIPPPTPGLSAPNRKKRKSTKTPSKKSTKESAETTTVVVSTTGGDDTEVADDASAAAAPTRKKKKRKRGKNRSGKNKVRKTTAGDQPTTSGKSIDDDDEDNDDVYSSYDH